MDKSTSGKTSDGRIIGVSLQVKGHCEFANGWELSIVLDRNGNMQVLECDKDELMGKKVGCKTLNQIENDMKIER